MKGFFLVFFSPFLLFLKISCYECILAGIQAILLPWFCIENAYPLFRKIVLFHLYTKCVFVELLFVCVFIFVQFYWSIRTNNLKFDAHFKKNKCNKKKHSLPQQMYKHIEWNIRRKRIYKIRHGVFWFFV